jgi:hypothetical protein
MVELKAGFENPLSLLKRSIEWVQWPLFISQPIVPVLLWFCDWQPVVAIVIFATIFWRLAIATWFVSVRLANFGAILDRLKFVTSPVMAFWIWHQGDRFGAAVALLWPFAVLVIQIFLNLFGVIGSALSRRNLIDAELEAVQSRFRARLSNRGTYRASNSNRN